MNKSQKTMMTILIIAGILEFLLIIVATCYIFSTETDALAKKVFELKLQLTAKEATIERLEDTIKERDNLILTLLDADYFKDLDSEEEN